MGENAGSGSAGNTDEGNKDDDKGGKDEGASNEQFEKLADGMKALASGMQTLQESHTKTLERLDDMAKPPKDDDEDEDLNANEADLEGMSRTEFANSIIDKVVKAVDKQIKQVSSSVDDVRKDSNTAALEREVEALEGKHKDFWDWQPEIRALAKENPGTSVKRLYNMAKQENPEKLAELTKKQEKDDGKGGDPSKGKKFGGLMPTSSTTESTDKMDKKSAAEKAFEDTMSDVAVGGGGD